MKNTFRNSSIFKENKLSSINSDSQLYIIPHYKHLYILLHCLVLRLIKINSKTKLELFMQLLYQPFLLQFFF